MHGLRNLRVIDFSSDIAGAYCTKLLCDAGADVIKVEPPGGDRLRRRSASGADLAGEDGALFRFLCHGKRSIVGRPEDEDVLALCAGSDLVVETFAPGRMDALGLRERFPALVWLSITPWGRGGPWTHRPATEFILQAECGSIGSRGLPGQEPFQAGGATTWWVGGTFAAVAATAAVHGARRTGRGEHVDFALLDVMNVAASNYTYLVFDLLGMKQFSGSGQTVETPSIEPTSDGYVGFCTNTRQQFSDFLLMIERPDLREDEGLAQFAGRMSRLAEWGPIVQAWTRKHTTAEAIEQASLLRIPVAPVNNGETVQSHEQLVARKVFRRDPGDRFTCPRPSYRIDRQEPPPFRPAPKLGEHTGRIEPRARPPHAGETIRLPLEGLRILDLTAWWAGPSSTHILACLGADVIHVESSKRPDGMRMVGGMLAGVFEQWWEASHFYLTSNTNKRDLTLDLSDPRGKELLERLIPHCDALVENFTPRVMDGFGITWERVHELNPRALYVRMPAFGLDGPWRDNTGFAQTMEQMTGLAWLTGHTDDQPRIQRGPCDPLAGMHAAFAMLVALAEREARGGEGVFVEATMVEGALNAAAEQLIEFTAYGNLMHRDGNRSPDAAPQGLYPCRDHSDDTPRWLALSVADDAQWEALKQVLGRPAWADDAAYADHAGRRAAHDALDAALAPMLAERDRDDWIESLLAAGVPAGRVVDTRLTHHQEQLRARGLFEDVDHPVVGHRLLPGQPFRFEGVEHWIRTPAPTLGQHNREILQGMLGLGDDEIEALEADGVIGTRPEGL